MKKLFTFLAVATFVVALSSCGGAKTEEATATEEVTATEEMPADMTAATETAATETAATEM
jgi:hypothetical protein